MLCAMRYATVSLLEESDNLLDHAPALHRDDEGRLRVVKGAWGCRAGLSTLAFRLADRWGVVVPPRDRCPWCREEYDPTDDARSLAAIV